MKSATTWVGLSLMEGAFFVVQWIVIGIAIGLVHEWTGRRAPAQAAVRG